MSAKCAQSLRLQHMDMDMDMDIRTWIYIIDKNDSRNIFKKL